MFICFQAVISVCLCQSVKFTQTQAVGVNLAYFDFSGANYLSSFGRHMKPGIALHFQNNFSSRFGYNISLAGSFLDFPGRNGENLSKGKKHLLIENEFSIWRRLLRFPALFSPYILAGVGWSQYNNHYGLYAPVGAGVQVNVTPDVFLLLNSQYRMRLSSLQYHHFYHSIGIAGTISRKKIVHEKKEIVQLPVATGKIQTDADGDGITDSLDACPQIAGVMEYKGCPIPDKDGDGIPDQKDLCPDFKGLQEHNGCPIADKDQDGIADAHDKCPDLAGSAVNNGCPEIETLKAWVNWMAKNILFETDGHRLLPHSHSSLDSLVELLKKHPVLNLKIEGHTDNVGEVKYNQTLSEKRAGAVRAYLISAGIKDASRVQSTGYGQQKPVSDNLTNEGRAKNRRVELKLYY